MNKLRIHLVEYPVAENLCSFEVRSTGFVKTRVGEYMRKSDAYRGIGRFLRRIRCERDNVIIMERKAS